MTCTLSRILPGTILSGLLLLSAAAWSMGPPDRPMGPPDSGQMFERLTQDLDLSDSQQEQIKSLFKQSQDVAQQDHARLRQLHEELRGMRQNFDETKAHAITDEIGQITARMAYRMSSNLAQVYAVLTPEQQKQLDQKMDEMHSRMESRKEKRTSKPAK